MSFTRLYFATTSAYVLFLVWKTKFHTRHETSWQILILFYFNIYFYIADRKATYSAPKRRRRSPSFTRSSCYRTEQGNKMCLSYGRTVFNTLRTGDADLRFYITTVQDGWRKSAFLTRACFPCTIHLIMQYIEPVCEWSCWWMFIETWPHSELTFRHRASSI